MLATQTMRPRNSAKTFLFDKITVVLLRYIWLTFDRMQTELGIWLRKLCKILIKQR